MKSSYSRALAITWERCDVVIFLWISVPMTPKLLTNINYSTSSRKIWNELKERFDKPNLTRFYHIWKELSMLTQGADSVTSYY